MNAAIKKKLLLSQVVFVQLRQVCLLSASYKDFKNRKTKIVKRNKRRLTAETGDEAGGPIRLPPNCHHKLRCWLVIMIASSHSSPARPPVQLGSLVALSPRQTHTATHIVQPTESAVHMNTARVTTGLPSCHVCHFQAAPCVTAKLPRVSLPSCHVCHCQAAGRAAS